MLYIGNKYFIGLVLGLLLFCSSYGQNTSDSINFSSTETYIYRITNYIEDGELELAKDLIDKGIKSDQASTNPLFRTNLNYYLADYYYYKQDYDAAQKIYMNVESLFASLKDTLMLAKTYNSIGLMYSFKQDNENELKYYLLESELLNKVTNKTKALKREEIVLITNLISHYSYDGRYNKVLEQGKIGVAYAKQLNDTIRLCSILNSLGLAYKNLDNWDKSLETFKEASEMFIAINDNFRNAFIENNIGGLYELDNTNLDSAYHYFHRALKGFEAESYQWGVTQAKLGVASVLSKFGKYNESEKYYQEIIDTTLHYEFNHVLADAYEGMAQTQYSKGKFKEAYEFNLLFIELKDSLFNEEKHRQYAELETKYEISQKENEINFLKSEKLSNELIIQQARLHQSLAIVILLLLFVFGIILFHFYRQKRLDNIKLQQTNDRVEKQNLQLHSKNENIRELYSKLQKSRKEIIKSDNAKNRFFSILAHDLRNPFHSVLGNAFLLNNSFDQISDQEKQDYAKEIFDSCNQVNQLLENLLEWSKTQTAGLVISRKNLTLNQLVKNTIALLNQNAEQKDIIIINTIANSVEVFADYRMLETILRNLVNNSIKFTNIGGEIVLSAKQLASSTQIIVADTGIGIPKENLNNLFEIDSNIKTFGTNNEKGSGLGLVICKEFLNLHQGKIWVESTVNEGSTFYVEIPIEPQN